MVGYNHQRRVRQVLGWPLLTMNIEADIDQLQHVTHDAAGMTNDLTAPNVIKFCEIVAARQFLDPSNDPLLEFRVCRIGIGKLWKTYLLLSQHLCIGP